MQDVLFTLKKLVFLKTVFIVFRTVPKLLFKCFFLAASLNR
jgi:hypothetical protein